MTGTVNANDVYIRSDRRLKKNLVKVRDALRKVSSLTAYSYDKKQTLEATEGGTIVYSATAAVNFI